MRTGKIISVLFAATVALGVSACGSDDAQGSAPEQQETTAQDTHELAKDVEIVSCAAADAIGVSATVEVTNSLDEPMEYIGTINFLDSSGKVLTDGIFNTGTLQPGQTGTEEVPGANVYEKVEEYTCELVEVKIDEPV